MSSTPAKPTVITLSRDEMRSRALAFAQHWTGPYREKSEARTFLDEFFVVFGRDRRAVRCALRASRRARRPWHGQCRLVLARQARRRDEVHRPRSRRGLHAGARLREGPRSRGAPALAARLRLRPLRALRSPPRSPPPPSRSARKKSPRSNPPTTPRKPTSTPGTCISAPRKNRCREVIAARRASLGPGQFYTRRPRAPGVLPVWPGSRAGAAGGLPSANSPLPPAARDLPSDVFSP